MKCLSTARNFKEIPLGLACRTLRSWESNLKTWSMVCVFLYNVLPTAKEMEIDPGAKSHEPEVELATAGYKASGLSTTPP